MQFQKILVFHGELMEATQDQYWDLWRNTYGNVPNARKFNFLSLILVQVHVLVQGSVLSVFLFCKYPNRWHFGNNQVYFTKRQTINNLATLKATYFICISLFISFLEYQLQYLLEHQELRVTRHLREPQCFISYSQYLSQHVATDSTSCLLVNNTSSTPTIALILIQLPWNSHLS